MGRHIDADTPASLLLRIRDPNNDRAWEEFSDVYSPLIYGFCRLRKLQPNDAADITQEVLLRVSKSIRDFSYDEQRGLFRDWIARIVSNEIHRHYSRRRDGSLPAGWDAESFANDWNEQFHQYIFSLALSRCRERFQETTWNLFEKSWIQKIPAEVVASDANVDISQVYVARSRVLKRLRVEVTHLADDCL